MNDVTFYANLADPERPDEAARVPHAAGRHERVPVPRGRDRRPTPAGAPGNYTYSGAPSTRIDGKYLDTTQPIFSYFDADGNPIPTPITTTAGLRSIDIVGDQPPRPRDADVADRRDQHRRARSQHRLQPEHLSRMVEMMARRLTQPNRSAATARDEAGLAMIIVITVVMLLTFIPLAIFTQAVQQLPLARHDQDHESALHAAEAGVDDYLNRLNQNSNYWTYNATNPPPDGNQAFTSWVPVPGPNDNGETFRYTPDTTKTADQRHDLSHVDRASRAT